jgi:hypothetical protein
MVDRIDLLIAVIAIVASVVGSSTAQWVALSNKADKDDVHRLETKLDAVEAKFEARFDAVETKFEARFDAVEQVSKRGSTPSKRGLKPRSRPSREHSKPVSPGWSRVATRGSGGSRTSSTG